MKKKTLKLLGIISAFFLSIFGLTGCEGRGVSLYGVQPVENEFEFQSGNTEDTEIKEDLTREQSEIADFSLEF